MHRAFILLQTAEKLAFLPPARVRDVLAGMGVPAGDGEDALRQAAGLKPAQIRNVLKEAENVTVVCDACGERTVGRSARRGNHYACGECGSGKVNVAGAQPIPAGTAGATDASDDDDGFEGGDGSFTRRITRSGPAVIGEADRYWQTTPFRQAGPFRLRHMIGVYDLQHARAVSVVAITPDGSRIVSGGFDHAVKLWDAATGRELRHLGSHNRRVTALAMAPSGETVTSAGLDGRIVIWHIGSGKQLVKLDAKRAVASLSLSRDGLTLAVGFESGQVKFLNGRSGKPIGELPGMTRRVVRDGPGGAGGDEQKQPALVALSPDGTRVALATTGTDRVRVWQAQPPRELGSFAVGEPVIAPLAFCGDDQLLVPGSSGAHVFKLSDGGASATKLRKIDAGARVASTAVSPDGASVAFGFVSGGARIASVTSGGKLADLTEAHRSRVNAVAVSGSRVVTGGTDHTVRLWSTSGSELVVPNGHRGQVVRVAVSLPDILTGGARILSAAEDGTARIVDLAGGTESRCYDGHSIRRTASAATRARSTSAASDRPIIRGAALSRDGSRAITAADTGEAHVWPVEGGDKPRVIRHPQGVALTSATWLAPLGAALPGHQRQGAHPMDRPITGGGLVALGDARGQVLLMDPADGRLIQTVRAHNREVVELSASDNGQRFLSVGGDGTARLFELGTPQSPVHRVGEFAHKDQLQTGSLSTDGRFIVLGSRDVAIVVGFDPYDVRAQLETKQGWVTAVAITPDNRWILTASEEGRLSVWGEDRRLRRWQTLGTLSLETATDFISAMTLRRDGKLLVAGTARGVLMTFDLAENFGVGS